MKIDIIAESLDNKFLLFGQVNGRKNQIATIRKAGPRLQGLKAES